jgi:hypothetical protein
MFRIVAIAVLGLAIGGAAVFALKPRDRAGQGTEQQAAPGGSVSSEPRTGTGTATNGKDCIGCEFPSQ